MIIGVVRCECMLYNAQSLKDKRAVIKSILTKAKQRFNISAAEISFHEAWQRTELVFTSVANEKVAVERELQKAIKLIDQNGDIERTETIFEWL
ncbi:hypothetical protein EV207_106114 [Scopulibacillus darangshiensis]|uniref:YlxP-like protein n=1 Tax=Scopulibacillus darangshiensis TaxID=442528 RepID=A0A4R2P8E1_9BACL|nr:DUF503 family protein [Scopulibacillus darangshiensis]TCP30291.1 hypothetical protein EV207_106114 [Scopulibacillus darangshiensis]